MIQNGESIGPTAGMFSLAVAPSDLQSSDLEYQHL